LEHSFLPPQGFGQPGSTVVLVGAPRCAWKRVELDLEGGEQVVALEPGADLLLHVRGCDPDDGARLRLRRTTEDFSRPCTQLDVEADGSLRLSGLPPGRLRVAGETGSSEKPRVLGMVSLELSAGHPTEATLDLSPAPALRRVEARGVVHVAEEWKLDGLSFFRILLDEPDEGVHSLDFVRTSKVASWRAGYEAFEWAAADLQVGSYVIELSDPGYLIGFDAPPGGLDHCEFFLPPPVELVVHVLDDSTGKIVEEADVAWFQRLGDRMTLEEDDVNQLGPGRYRIRAPAAVIELHVNASTYGSSLQSLDLSRGLREHAVRLQGLCQFTLRLANGATPVAPPHSWSVHVESALGGGHVINMWTLETVLRCRVSDPGTYFVALREPPGFEPVPIHSIEVRPDQHNELVIQLERER
jgi:hypothetical protein